MDPIPYTNFWKEEPKHLQKAWRPTDGARRKLWLYWSIQAFLLFGILVVGVLIANESKVIPPIYAKLPNGMVFEATAKGLQLDRLARVELVNNTLNLLYYQDGKQNYLNYAQGNVKRDILLRLSGLMQSAPTNSTVHMVILESFETVNVPAGFEAMTKGMLVKRTNKTSSEAPVYIRTHWEWENDRLVLTAIYEVSPGDYSDAFDREKARLHKLTKEELQRELNVRKSYEVPVQQRGPLF